ncbi:MAG: septation protein A [Hyphomicrobiaceae bacterium]
MKLFIKLVLEFLPLGLFFIFTDRYDVYVGTAALMVATVICMGIIWIAYRQIAIMALITAATGLISGALTLYLTDPLYVKLKPTIVSLLFAAILYGGLMFRKALLKPLLGEDLHLTDIGWRLVTHRWGLYFLFIAVLNEAIWRNFSIEFWAGFKAFALTPLTVLYALSQVPLLRRHRTHDAPENPTVDQIADFLEGTRGTARSATTAGEGEGRGGRAGAESEPLMKRAGTTTGETVGQQR